MPAEYCFLISPVGSADSDVRRRADEITKFIVDRAVAGRFYVQRSDKESIPGSITRQIVRWILGAKFIVADLTGWNANVFYELGVAHSFGKAVILMIDDPDLLPFDVRHERTIALGGVNGSRVHLEDAERAAIELSTAIDAVLGEEYHAQSVVTEEVQRQSLAELQSADPVASEVESLSAQMTEFRRRLREVEQASATAEARGVNRLYSAGFGAPIFSSSVPLGSAAPWPGSAVISSPVMGLSGTTYPFNTTDPATHLGESPSLSWTLPEAATAPPTPPETAADKPRLQRKPRSAK